MFVTMPFSIYSGLLFKYAKRTGNSTVVPDELRDGSVQFVAYDNFTVAVLYNSSKHPPIIGVGMAKRMPKDENNRDIGRTIALWRAFDDYYKRKKA